MYRCRIAHSCLLVGLLSSVALSKTDFDLALLKDLDPSSIDLKGLKGLEGLDGLKGLEGLGEFDLFSDKLGLLKGEKNKKKEVCDLPLPKLPKFDCPAPPPPCTVSNTRTESFNTEEGDGCNLSPLAGVCRIEGDLEIEECLFEDLNVLSSLREVTGTIDLGKPFNLKNLDGFSGLVRVEGELSLDELPLVTQVAPPGFCNLELAGDLEIDNSGPENWGALELILLPNLRNITSAFGGEAGIEIDDFREPLKAILFPKLENVDNGIEIDDHVGLKLIYFPELVTQGQSDSADEDIEIDTNCDLEIIYFPKLELAREIEVDDNKNLKCVNFASLKRTTAVSSASGGPVGIDINDNLDLVDIRLDSLESISDGVGKVRLEIADNPSLKELSLPHLTSLTSSVDAVVLFSGNLALQHLSAPKLTTIAGGEGNPNAPSVLNMTDLPSLKKLDFPSLTTLDVPLLITQTQLQNLDAFSGVSMVAGGNSFLSIQHNTKLTSVEGLSNAVSAGVFLNAQICDNPSLSSLPASFSNLNAMGVVCDTSDPVCDCSF